MSSKNLAKFLVISLIFLYLTHGLIAEEQLSLRWSYEADDNIKALAYADIDNDNHPEIFIASSDKLYVLDINGTLKKEYPIKFSPSALFIADIDNDGIKEILIGSGWMNTTEITEGRFEFEDIRNIKEKAEFLYRITRNQGHVYIIQEDIKEPVKWFEVGEWIRSIFVDDLDNDRNKEIIIASGGTNINYIELIHTEINNKTGNLTYVRNYTEEYSENGSVRIFNNNGSLISSYLTKNTVWCVYPSFIQEGESKDIVLGSKNIISIDKNASEIWTFKSLGENYSIRRILIDDIDQNNVSEIIATFTSPILSGIHVLSKDGSEIWQYRIPSKNIQGLSSINLDIDSEKEIVIASLKNIYVLDTKGKAKWTYESADDIDKIHVTDLGDNEFKDFIIVSGNRLFVYEITEDFIKLQIADRYYQKGKEYYASANYQDALESTKEARDLYSELGNSEKISICDSLLENIKKGMAGISKDNADSLYMKALSKYYLGEYKEAREYAKKAKEIYMEIEDHEGISKCNSLLKDIESEIGSEVTTTVETSIIASTTVEETTTVTTEVGGIPLTIMLLMIIAVILIIFGIYQIISGRSRKKE